MTNRKELKEFCQTDPSSLWCESISPGDTHPGPYPFERPSEIPLPAPFLLLLCALGALAVVSRRR